MGVGQRNELMRKIIILNFLIVILLVIFFELISNFFKLSGLMGIQDGLIYEKENTNYLLPNNEGTIFNQRVFTDEHGFRVPSKNFKYSNYDNIFILGDSVAFGNGIEEQKTFIGLLRRNIKEKNFLNSSVPGYQIKDHVSVIRKTQNFNNINKILYFFTLNDIYGESNVVNLNNSKKDESNYFLKRFEILNQINAFLRNKSYLFMFIKGMGTDPSKRWFLNLNSSYKNKDFTKFEENIIYLNEYANNLKSQFIVILLPYEYQTRDCSNEILKPQQKIITILNNLNINFTDLTDKFCDKEKPKKYFYKFDPMHLSQLGHLLVFESLKDEITF